MNNNLLNETLSMLKRDLKLLDQEIESLKQTLVERETKYITIINAIDNIERMLQNGKISSN